VDNAQNLHFGWVAGIVRPRPMPNDVRRYDSQARRVDLLERCREQHVCHFLGRFVAEAAAPI